MTTQSDPNVQSTYCIMFDPLCSKEKEILFWNQPTTYFTAFWDNWPVIPTNLIIFDDVAGWLISQGTIKKLHTLPQW